MMVIVNFAMAVAIAIAMAVADYPRFVRLDAASVLSFSPFTPTITTLRLALLTHSIQFSATPSHGLSCHFAQVGSRYNFMVKCDQILMGSLIFFRISLFYWIMCIKLIYEAFTLINLDKIFVLWQTREGKGGWLPQ